MEIWTVNAWTQFPTATFGLSKRHICQELSKWRLRSAGLANAAGWLLSRTQKWWPSIMRPTGAVVAIAGPLHISTSVPTEFESMLGEAAELAPEGVERPLHYLRSRILARHTHAMLKRGVTLVTVYLEPGMRASGLNLWLLEVLAACILCFDGPWIAMGDWNLEAKDLAQAGWLETVSGKVFSIGSNLCRRSGAQSSVTSCCSRRRHTWCNRSKWWTTLPLLHIRLSVSLSPHLGVTGVLARRRPKPFPTEVPVGPQRQEEHFDWTWAAEDLPVDLELAWLEWLRAAEAAWCQIRDL